jgi:purine-binding chemotaxis protein CheW
MFSEQFAYLAASANDIHLAIPLEAVQEVVSMPRVTAVPQVPPHVRGVINLRGSVVPLIDLRVILGVKSLQEQLVEIDTLLAARLEDHKRWVGELEACVKEGRPFKLARNPHMCAFGKWYDSYRPANDSITFQAFWRSFDRPHQQIHEVADVALALAGQGRKDEAMALIAQKRGAELAVLIGLFSQARGVMGQTSRELAILLRRGAHVIAISVDKVQTVVRIPSTQIEPLARGQIATESPLLRRVAKAPDSSQVRLVLEVESLFGSAAA